MEARREQGRLVGCMQGVDNRRDWRGACFFIIVSPERLARQFDVMTRIADLVPVRRLAYPRTIDRLPEVRDVVLADLGVTDGAAAAHVV